jgi:phosphoribosylformimino-5-aminoimidazole carboxamide ribotide isomerase
VLSLDFQGDAFLGPRQLLNDASLWPAEVIVMTLDRVGNSNGPALERLASIVSRAEGRRIYAAGGVRNAADIQALQRIGVVGALTTTALHSGTLIPVGKTPTRDSCHKESKSTG